MELPSDCQSLSFALAQHYLGHQVRVVVDRPLGSSHPRHGFPYELNYGHLPGTVAPDGEELDAYILGVDTPVDEFTGTCLAVIHRFDDDDDKLVIAPADLALTEDQLSTAVEFQERAGQYEIRWA